METFRATVQMVKPVAKSSKEGWGYAAYQVTWKIRHHLRWFMLYRGFTTQLYRDSNQPLEGSEKVRVLITAHLEDGPSLGTL